MGLLKFGYTVDMEELQNPAIPESFLIGYDLDGVLKQKDYLGNITPIGSVTTIVGVESNFLLSSSGLDSLGNKTASIIRSGGLRIGTTYSYTEMTSNSIKLNIDTGGSTSTLFTINDSYLQFDGSLVTGEILYWDPYSGLQFYNYDYSLSSGFSSYQLSLYDSDYTTNIYAYGMSIYGTNSALYFDTNNGFYIESPGTGMSHVHQISASFSRFTQQTSYPNTLTLLPTTLSGDQVQYYQNKSGTFSLISDVIDSSLFYLVGSTNSVINSKTQSIYRTGNIGIGTASPSTKLHIYATASGAFRLEDGTQGSNYILKSDSNGLASWTPLSSIGISGSASYIPVFTGTSSLGNSILYIEPSLGRALIINPGRGLLSSLSYLSVQRGQSQVDIILGNPTYYQNSAIVSDNDDGFLVASKGPLLFSAGGINTDFYPTKEAMRISTNGYVGIGLTATPSTKLHIYATQSGFGFRLQDGSQGNNYILTSNSIGMGSWTSSINVTGFRLQTGAQPGYILTSDASGIASWTSSATPIYWYTENTTAPSTAPIATGTASIAIGNNAKALSSNMFVYGESAGLDATGSDYSNFLGYFAGFQTQDSPKMNIIGNYAGFQSPDSDSSNFIGNYAGFQSHDSIRSNNIGDHAGIQSPDSTNSNFIGTHAGAQSSNITNSNFIGEAAGKLSSYAIFSNFIGNYAGQASIYSDYSNFIGDNAGQNAPYTGNSNFIGRDAGKGSSGASYSNFLGRGSGQNAGSANNSNFIGNLAGNAALSAFNSNFLGQNSGKDASFANNSNFLGFSAGENSVFANNSNFLGQYAGQDAYSANNSNFIGNNAGQNADNANNSNFIGERAGKDATNANNSNFLGQGAGQNSTIANNSNFFGQNSGLSSYSNNSNFFGQNSGELTLAAHYSNFFGFYAGAGANDANNSNFFGYAAGQNATGASNSNLFGFNAGKSFTLNNIGSNNIVIGTNISLPDGATNSINIGGVLFGLNTHSDTIITDPSIVAQTNGRIGINVVNPTANLHVYGTQPGAFRLEDGSQANGYVLTSDATGVASWTASKPYKVYTAILTRTGATGPSASVLENTLGTLTYNYDSVGVYSINSSGLFTLNKTIVFVQNNSDGFFGNVLGASRSTNNKIDITQTTSSGTNDDDWTLPVSIEIRVYN